MKKHIRDVLIAILVPVILIVIVETIARAYFISPSSINAWGYNVQGLGDLLPNRNFIADEGPLPYRVITNSQGLRSEKEFALPKPAGKFRILAIGDSLTFGPYVNQQDTYPNRLGQDLVNADINAEVINAGISGYTLEDELSYLQEKGIHLQPDLVILQVFQNDVSDYNPPTRQLFSRKLHKQSNPVFSTIYNLAKQSATLTVIEKYLAAQQVKTARQKFTASVNNSSVDDLYSKYFSDLDKLESVLNQTKIPILFVFIPSYDQVDSTEYLPQTKIMERVENKYPILDLLPIFKNQQYPYSLYLLPANGHLSAYGNFITASAIASETAKIYNITKQ